jgi:hypothetical protein
MRLSIYLVVLLFTTNAFAQLSNIKIPKSEISVLYNFGFSNSNFQIPTNDYDGRMDVDDARSYYDQGFMLRYQHSISTKGKNRYSVGTGIGFSNSQHYQFITDPKYRYLLEAVIFSNKTITVPAIISCERELIKEKLFLELSYSLNYNLPTEKHQTYTNAVEKKYNFIDYKYTLNVNNKSNISHWISLTSKLKLKNNLFMNSSLSLLASNRIYYDYEYRIGYYSIDSNGSAILNSTTGYESLKDTKIKDSYIYLSIGLSCKL